MLISSYSLATAPTYCLYHCMHRKMPFLLAIQIFSTIQEIAKKTLSHMVRAAQWICSSFASRLKRTLLWEPQEGLALLHLCSSCISMLCFYLLAQLGLNRILLSNQHSSTLHIKTALLKLNASLSFIFLL
jgi:hypothetical protein